MKQEKKYSNFSVIAAILIDNYNGVADKIEKFTLRGIEAQLTGMGKVNTYMPPFAGSEAEKHALAELPLF